MNMSFLQIIGFSLSIQFSNGDPCIDVLHELINNNVLRIEATNTVGDRLVYTLKSKTGKKAAHLGCTIAP